MTKIKQEIEDEYNLVREMQIEEQNERDRQRMLMPEEERQQLITALKKKWEELMRDYQKESHHGKLDTIGKKGRKEVLEAQMDQVEADIKKLQKNYIFVDTTAPSTMFWAVKSPQSHQQANPFVADAHTQCPYDWMIN